MIPKGYYPAYHGLKVHKVVTLAGDKADLVTAGSKAKVYLRSFLIHPDQRVIASYLALNRKGKKIRKKKGKRYTYEPHLYALYKLRK
jgi:hypothetical protein